MSEKIEITLLCGEKAKIEKSDLSDGIGYVCYNYCPDSEINGYTDRCSEFDDLISEIED